MKPRFPLNRHRPSGLSQNIMSVEPLECSHLVVLDAALLACAQTSERESSKVRDWLPWARLSGPALKLRNLSLLKLYFGCHAWARLSGPVPELLKASLLRHTFGCLGRGSLGLHRSL